MSFCLIYGSYLFCPFFSIDFDSKIGEQERKSGPRLRGSAREESAPQRGESLARPSRPSASPKRASVCTIMNSIFTTMCVPMLVVLLEEFMLIFE